MANAFDQFDEAPQQTPQKTANPFDQFDAPAPPSPQPGAYQNYVKPFVDTFKGGVQDAVDVVAHPIKTLQASNPTATSEDEANSPAYQNLVAKMNAGTDTRGDKEAVLLEAAGKTLPGKIMGAAAGIIPEGNIVSTALSKWINPAVAKATGATPEELQLGEMVAAPLAMKAAKIAPTDIPTVDEFTDMVAHPVQRLARGANRITSTASAVAKPVVRNILENDNPITGEPGLQTALASDTAIEGKRLGDKMGVQFSTGELTGNPTARNIEDALANSARHGGTFEEAHQAKTDAIVSKFQDTLDQIHASPTGPQDVGSRLSAAYNGTINSLIQARSAQAARDAEAAGIQTQGQPTIQPTNFIGVLKDYIDEGNSPTATPAQKAASGQAKTLLNNLKAAPPKTSPILDASGNPIKSAPTETYKNITIKDLQNGLAAFGEGAKAGGGIWKGLSTASDRRFSGAAKDALMSDMDASIQNGGTDAAALKTFRDNYRANSNKIADIQQTTLGKIVGSAERNSQGQLVIQPEAMASKFAKMQPSELKSTLDFLDKHHPDVANMARRYVLETALQKAQEGQGQRGAGTTKAFAKAEFVKALPPDDKLNAMFGDSNAASDIKDVAAAMNRMIDYGAAKKGSDTARRSDWLHNLAHIGKRMLYRAIVSDSLAKDLLDPAKRQQIAIEARKSQTTSGQLDALLKKGKK